VHGEGFVRALRAWVADRRAKLDERVLRELRTAPSFAYDLQKRMGVRLARLFPALDRLMASGVVGDRWVEDSQGERPARREYFVRAGRGSHD
jgi:DNA-binding PadR family transcriptional regulator